jgi:hypothetical protein
VRVTPHTADIGNVEEVLHNALVAVVGGTRPVVSTLQVTQFLSQFLQVQANEVQVQRSFPDDPSGLPWSSLPRYGGGVAWPAPSSPVSNNSFLARTRSAVRGSRASQPARLTQGHSPSTTQRLTPRGSVVVEAGAVGLCMLGGSADSADRLIPSPPHVAKVASPAGARGR